ncbi:MAG: GNAT family N-acetyltransferase [Candidatus Latescibacterota bacterium]|nr:MAG: GNAT family N-acetyltransferase [Candidatus Latescibacterota bacterium]
MTPTIKTFHTFDDARETWKTFQDEGESYVFQSYEWLSSWYHHIGRVRGDKPFLVAVYDETGEPICFLALAVVMTGGMKTLTWLGDPLNDYGAPIVMRDITGFGDVWNGVAAHLPPVDIVRLPKIPDRVGGVPNPLCELGCRRYHSSAHFVRLEGDWGTFYEKRTGAKTRSTDRRKHRRLSEKGTLSHTVTDGSDRAAFDVLTRAMIDQKGRRYIEINTRNILDDARYRDFFATPTEDLMASGQLQLAGLLVDNQPITTHWGMVYAGRFYYYMPSYAAGEWRRYSPGRLLLFHLFEWCLENGIEVFDFTIGDEEYKKDWCDEEMPLYEYFEPRSLKGRLYGVYYNLRRFLLGNAAVLDLARRVKRFFYRLRYART